MFPSPRRLVLTLVLGALLASLAVAPAADGLCSLDWAAVLESFGPGSGWAVAAPPIPLAISGEDMPDYQAQLFESPGDRRSALVIAEWGEADSPDLGALVYCTVHDADGRVLEEVGRNPIPGGTPAVGCRRDECV